MNTNQCRDRQKVALSRGEITLRSAIAKPQTNNKNSSIHAIRDRSDRVCMQYAVQSKISRIRALAGWAAPETAYPFNTVLLDPLDNTTVSGGTGGAKPSKRNAARAARRNQSTSQTSKPNSPATGQRQRLSTEIAVPAKEKKCASEIFGPRSKLSGPKP